MLKSDKITCFDNTEKCQTHYLTQQDKETETFVRFLSTAAKLRPTHEPPTKPPPPRVRASNICILRWDELPTPKKAECPNE